MPLTFSNEATQADSPVENLVLPPPVVAYNPLDFNHDGVVNWDDAHSFFAVNEEGKVDTHDFRTFFKHLIHRADGQNPFDLNHDGVVNWEDLKVLGENLRPFTEIDWQSIQEKFFPALVNFIDTAGNINPIIKQIVLDIIYTIDSSPNLPQDTFSEKLAAFTGEQIRALIDRALHIKLQADQRTPSLVARP